MVCILVEVEGECMMCHIYKLISNQDFEFLLPAETPSNYCTPICALISNEEMKRCVRELLQA